MFFGRALSYRRAARAGRGAGRLAAGARREQGRPRGAVHAELPAVRRSRATAILRANAVVVPVNPMNRADEFSHYITDPRAPGSSICSADLAGIVARRECAGCPRRSALRAGAGDALHRRHARRRRSTPADAPAAADRALAARRRRRCRPAARRWRDALAASARARPAHRGARRPGAAALHLGHHRPAQGLHAHPPHADAQRGRRGQWGHGGAGDGGAGRGADVPHHRHDVRRARRRSTPAPPWC